jgi:hypothetical protein
MVSLPQDRQFQSIMRALSIAAAEQLRNAGSAETVLYRTKDFTPCRLFCVERSTSRLDTKTMLSLAL